MKRLLLTVSLLAILGGMQAADYKYLVLEQTDGTTVDLPTENLSLTFSGGNLVASNGTTLPVASLAQMFFSKDPTGIEEIADKGRLSVLVYTPEGHFAGRFDTLDQARWNLKKGIYIVKKNNETLKIAVK